MVATEASDPQEKWASVNSRSIWPVSNGVSPESTKTGPSPTSLDAMSKAWPVPLCSSCRTTVHPLGSWGSTSFWPCPHETHALLQSRSQAQRRILEVVDHERAELR